MDSSLALSADERELLSKLYDSSVRCPRYLNTELPIAVTKMRPLDLYGHWVGRSTKYNNHRRVAIQWNHTVITGQLVFVRLGTDGIEKFFAWKQSFSASDPGPLWRIEPFGPTKLCSLSPLLFPLPRNGTRFMRTATFVVSCPLYCQDYGVLPSNWKCMKQWFQTNHLGHSLIFPTRAQAWCYLSCANACVPLLFAINLIWTTGRRTIQTVPLEKNISMHHGVDRHVIWLCRLPIFLMHAVC